MSGTRAAPAVTGAATWKQLSMKLIDAENISKSFSLLLKAAATPAEVEDLTAKIQLATRASIWSVSIADVWQGGKDKDNAQDAGYISVNDQITFGYKDDVSRAYVYGWIPAPLTTLINPNNVPAIGDQLVIDVRDAFSLVIDDIYGGKGTWFTTNQKRNKKTSFTP